MWKVLSCLVFLAACTSQPAKSPSPYKRQKAKVTKPRTTTEAVVEAKADLKLLNKLSQRNVVIMDLRDVNEFVNGHLKGAVHMDFSKDGFEAQVAKLSRQKKYLLYCSNGGRSGKAMHYFMAKKLRVENIGTYDELKSRGALVEGVEE